jgi:hypothetical protein
MSSLSGLSFGRYHLLEPLGEGGITITYRLSNPPTYSSDLLGFRCATSAMP